MPEVGVVTGLAWTATGGDLMVIEALRMPGSGRLTVTGQLGDVMRESRRRGVLVRALARGAARHRRTRRSRSSTCTSTFPPARSRRTGRARASR